jgi:hypothetical protein
MHGSRSKIPSKKSRQQRCAEGFNSGVKGLMKIPPVGAELFHVNGQTENPDEANSRFRA